MIFQENINEQKTFERYIKNKEEPCVTVLRKGHLMDDRCFPSFLSRDIMVVIISKVKVKNANEFTLRENSSLLGRPLRE